MNKLLKWILAGIGIVVVLFVIAAVVLPRVIDPNNYKDNIRASVLEETGRELTIGGEIEWTVFPSIGLGLSAVELGNRSGFGEKPMLMVGSAEVSVKLLPLFSRKIEIGQVSLSDVSANLQRKANGQNNWEDLGKGAGETTADSSTGGGIDSLVISGIDVNNASVTLIDAGQVTELTGFGLKVSSIEMGRPFKLEGGFSVNLSESQLSGDVKFKGLVSSQHDGSRYGIEGLGFSFSGTQGAKGESKPLKMSVNANADLNLDSDQATLSDFVFQLHELTVTGELSVTSLSKGPKFEGQLSVDEFSPKAFLKSMGQEVPVTADTSALTSLQADMNFAGSSNSANMRNLKVKFDKSTFNGQLKVDNFGQPKLAFNFQIDSLNLDEYLHESSSAEQDLTVEALRGFTGGGDFKIGTLVLGGLTTTDVSMTMSSNGKGVRFNPVSARFYGGQHKGDISVDASGNRPILTASQFITGINAQEFLKDLTGSARLEGVGDFNLEIRTDLTNTQTSTQDLSGNFALSVLDGAIVGIDVAQSIRSAKAMLGKKTETTADAGGDSKTDFSELNMTGIIEQGVIKSDDLLMRSPLLRVTGKGKVDLVKESINYQLKPVLIGHLEGQDGEGLDELKGVPIPVKLTGNMYEPDISVDIVAAVTGAQKDALIGKLLGNKSETDANAEEGEEKAQKDPAASLIDSVFGSKKDKKKKKKKEEGGGN